MLPLVVIKFDVELHPIYRIYDLINFILFNCKYIRESTL